MNGWEILIKTCLLGENYAIENNFIIKEIIYSREKNSVFNYAYVNLN